MRADLPDRPPAGDPLTEHLLRLLTLHPQLTAYARPADVPGLSAADRAKLLAELNAALGIRPLKTA